MKNLIGLSEGLSNQDKEDWAKRLNLLEERANDDDEILIILEAIGLLAVSYGKKIDAATSSIADRKEVISAKDIERIIKESVNIPGFQELRGFVMDTKALHERNEARQGAEDKNLEQIDRITSELKSLTGKSFLLWMSCMTTGALVGFFCYYLPTLIERYV